MTRRDRQEEVLTALDSRDMTRKEIADATGLDDHAVNSVVRRLERRGEIYPCAVVHVLGIRSERPKKPSALARMAGRDFMIYTTDPAKAKPDLMVARNCKREAVAAVATERVDWQGITRAAIASRLPLELAWSGLAA